jgi:hypothetical protein
MDFLGSRDSLDRAASVLLVAQEVTTDARSNLAGGVSQLVPERWRGAAAAGFQDHWTAESSSIKALTAVMTEVARILDDLSSEMGRAERVAADGVNIAHSAGLGVGPDGQVLDQSGPARFALPLSAHLEMQRADAQERIDSARAIAEDARVHAFAELANVTVPAIGDRVSGRSEDGWPEGSVTDQAGVGEWYHRNGDSLAVDSVQVGAGGAFVEAGLGLIGAGVGGEVGGIALDATGIGAVGGVPLNVAGVSLVVSGGAMVLGGAAVAGAGLVDGAGRVADGIGVLLSKKQQAPELSAAEREALENRELGKPYDQRAYRNAVRKIQRGEKFQGDRNRQKRANS